MAQSPGWLARNSATGYPFQAAASLLDNEGVWLPEQLIADMRLAFPGNANDVAYVSYVYLGATITLTVSVGSEEIAILQSTPLEQVTPQTQRFKLTPLKPGVYGTVCLGYLTGVTSHTWRFNGPSQSGLMRTQVTPYLPQQEFQRIRTADDNSVTGEITRFVGDGDFSTSKEWLEINGEVREVIAVGISGANPRELLQEYAGPCGRRPESETCNDPEPYRNLGTVQPDCCGRIFIELRGCFEISELVNAPGVVITCDSQPKPEIPKHFANDFGSCDEAIEVESDQPLEIPCDNPVE